MDLRAIQPILNTEVSLTPRLEAHQKGKLKMKRLGQNAALQGVKAVAPGREGVIYFLQLKYVTKKILNRGKGWYEITTNRPLGLHTQGCRIVSGQFKSGSTLVLRGKGSNSVLWKRRAMKHIRYSTKVLDLNIKGRQLNRANRQENWVFPRPTSERVIPTKGGGVASNSEISSPSLWGGVQSPIGV